MDDVTVFWICAVIATAVVLSLLYIIANEFYSVAIAKGYEDKKYFWYSFFLGIIGYLLVIALPDKKIEMKYDADELPEI